MNVGNTINWKDEYSVGVKVFDTHHKTLFNYINEFHEDMHEGKIENNIEKHLERFSEYADFHLKAEEEMFEKYDYPEKKKHQEIHDEYRIRMEEFRKTEKKDEAFAFEVLQYLENWWVYHVTMVDKKYEEFFQEKGLK